MADGATDIDPAELERREAVMDEFSNSLNSDDVEVMVRTMVEHCHPEIEWIEDPSWPGATNSHGLEDLTENTRERMETFQWHQTIERILHAGEVTVVLAVWRARGRISEVETELSLAEVASWRHDKLARMQFYLDRERALREAGIEDG